MRLRRPALYASSVVALWLVALVVLDAIYGARTGSAVAARLGDSLHAQATIGDTELGLVRGRLELANLAVHRDDVGHLAIDVAAVRCELAPLGWALIDGECHELAIRGVRVEVSTMAVFQIEHRNHAPIRARRVVVDDATFGFSPSAFVPDLGRIEIRIDHAESHETTFKTPLSWLFALDELRARVTLPAGVTVELGYHAGVLTAAGSLFGSKPVALPVRLPVADVAGDPRAEVAALIKLGSELAERLVEQRARDWIDHL